MKNHSNKIVLFIFVLVSALSLLQGAKIVIADSPKPCGPLWTGLCKNWDRRSCATEHCAGTGPLNETCAYCAPGDQVE